MGGTPLGIIRINRRIRYISLGLGAAALLAGMAWHKQGVAASVAWGLVAGVLYFQLIAVDATLRGKSGIMNAVLVLMARGRLLIVVGAAVAAAYLPGLSLPGTLAGLVATEVAFLVAASRP